MIVIHDFGVSLAEYFSLGRDNEFPSLDKCLACKAKAVLLRHGYYERNAIQEKEYRIVILRLKCKHCQKTVSILPSFLFSGFQHGVAYIVKCLKDSFSRNKKSTYRQKLSFYKKRFMKNMYLVEGFFRTLGNREKIPKKPIKKAMKLVELITLSGEETFAKRFQNHFNKHFMAS